MLKRLSRLKNNSDNIEDLDYNKILDELERSYSSIQSLNSIKVQPKKNKRRSPSPESDFLNVIKNDQFQSLQLAEILEKTALELRVFCKRRTIPSVRRNKKIPPCITENIFLITFLWQMLCIGLLEIADVIWKHFEKTEKEYYYTVIIFMVVFQFSNLIVAMAVTIKLTKQYIHKTASMGFLLQSYVATILLFSGMYTFLAKIEPRFFKGLHGKDDNGYLQSLKLFAQLLFMSVSTGTLCGASTVTALHISTEIIMSIQMLLSFIYFASILSQAINPGGEKSRTDMHRILMQQNDKLLDEYANKIEHRPRGRTCETI